MISSLLSRILILGFGYLYPAYCSYKAIRTKNVKEYVRWMMHWVVFSGFVAFETMSDMFISWFPFYYEVKLAIVFWLLSPMTKGSSHVYRSFIHPKLSQHEQDIDDYINQAKEKGYKAVLEAGSKTFDFASKLIVETAIKATASVVTTQAVQQRSITDVTDAPAPLPSVLTQNANIDEEYYEQESVFEFSDVEMEPEPAPLRTRSQSRSKEPSLPPAEPLPTRQKLVRRTIKETKSRRRQRVIEEDEDDAD